ncbi:MAG: GTP cyclohydrolase II RibA [Planctomycetota bacterium]
MIHLLHPPLERGLDTCRATYLTEIGRRLGASGQGDATAIPAFELEAHVRKLATDQDGGVMVLDGQYIELLGVPEWLRELPALLPSRLLLHGPGRRSPDAPPPDDVARAHRAWAAAVDAVIATAPRFVPDLAGEGTYYVVRPGIGDVFRPAPRPSRGGRHVISVGPLVPSRGHLELVRALAEVATTSQGTDTLRLTLIGDHEAAPTYTTAVRAAAGPLQLEILGVCPAEEVAKQLQRADLYASAALDGSYGLAVTEAAAVGLPVIAFRIGELDAWIRDGVNGHLVAPGDTGALRQTLRDILAEPERLEQLRAAALSRDALPTWEQAATRFTTACRHHGTPPSGLAHRIAMHSECDLPTEFGTFAVRVYTVDDEEHAVLVRMGDLAGDAVFTRVHSECFTGEVLASLKCDCDAQLRHALRMISERGRGAVVYLRQEGRGIGLGNKIRAYAEQAKGADTVEANRLVGFPNDLRDFSAAAHILRVNGVERVTLHTNNPFKVRALRQGGVAVEQVLPSVMPSNPHNESYLRVKYATLGHLGLRDALAPTAAAARTGSEGSPTAAPAAAPADLLIFDLDGVLQFGDVVPPAATELIARLREAGYALRFLTNDGFNSRRSRLAQLRTGGLEVEERELYTSSYLAARFLADRGPILSLCGPPGADELAALPQSQDAPRFVVVGDWFPHYDHAQLQAAFAALRRGAELVALHRKPHWRRHEEVLIDVGFWVAGLEYATQRRATLVGKPAEFAYRTVLEDAGCKPERAIMISDEHDPDLTGAAALGLRTVLLGDPPEPATNGNDAFAGRSFDTHAALGDYLAAL